jgi:hypothetical protein
MKNYEYFGKVPLPRGAFRDLKKDIIPLSFWKRQMKRNGVGQVGELAGTFASPEGQYFKNFGDALTEFNLWLDELDIGAYDSQVLLFKSVTRHSDDWPKMARKINGRNRWVASGFLHLVVGGTFDMSFLGKTRSYSRGDLFIMNPNCYHEVKTKSPLCATLHACVPLQHGIETLSQQFSS